MAAYYHQDCFLDASTLYEPAERHIQGLSTADRKALAQELERLRTIAGAESIWLSLGVEAWPRQRSFKDFATHVLSMCSQAT
jgi:PIN domain nuclease of toxin-antitoxin system